MNWQGDGNPAHTNRGRGGPLNPELAGGDRGAQGCRGGMFVHHAHTYMTLGFYGCDVHTQGCMENLLILVMLNPPHVNATDHVRRAERGVGWGGWGGGGGGEGGDARLAFD